MLNVNQMKRAYIICTKKNEHVIGFPHDHQYLVRYVQVKTKLVLSLFVFFLTFQLVAQRLFPRQGFYPDQTQCTIGYAFGNAVDDGRPIIWRNYDWNNSPHATQVLPHNYNTYLDAWGPAYWIATSQESWYVFGGVNQHGVGTFLTLITDFSDEGNYDYGNYRINGWNFGNATSVADVRKAIDEQIKFWGGKAGGVDHDWYYPSGNGGFYPAMTLVVIDAKGNGSMFEIGRDFYYEYDHTKPARLAQFPIQVGNRSNQPHRRTDHCDNTGTDWKTTGGRRYLEARANFQRLATNGNGLTIQEVMDSISRFGVPGFEQHVYGTLPLDSAGEYQNCNWKNQDGSIIWGAAPNEDPLSATFFIAMGPPAYSCFLPMWAANYNSLSNRLTTLSTQSIVYYVWDLFNKRVDAGYGPYIKSLFRNMENNNREAVELVRSYWNQNGFSAVMADKITDEAAENVYSAVKKMAGGTAYALNAPPKINSMGVTWNGMTGTFNVNATDDGSVNSYNWDFGDGTTGTGANPSHVYTTTGKFLVRVRATDNANVTNSKWMLVDVGVVITTVSNIADKAKMNIFPNPANDILTISGVNSATGIRLLSLIGETVLDFGPSNNTYLVQLNVSQLPKGVYLLEIIENDHRIMEKILVQ